jgi:phytoene dehydrogenase-like protein
LVDKVKVGIFSLLIRGLSIDRIFDTKEVTTEAFLEQELFLSSKMVKRFFNPFYQGIFLAPLRYQSSRMFNFVFKMFTEGAASLPAGGMGTIGTALAAKLPPDSIQFGTKVESLGDKVVVATQEGREGTKRLLYECDTIIMATDPPTAATLVCNAAASGSGGAQGVFACLDIDVPPPRSSTCIYYGMSGPPPISEPVLVLNGENEISEESPSTTTINNLCFPSIVSDSYAPEGKSLASVTVVGMASGTSDTSLDQEVRKQLGEWFPQTVVDEWELLRIYRIPYAQPSQAVPYGAKGKPEKLQDNLYVCGDYRGTATLNGAMETGRKAALAYLRDQKLEQEFLSA